MKSLYFYILLCLLFLCGAIISKANAEDFLYESSFQMADAVKTENKTFKRAFPLSSSNIKRPAVKKIRLCPLGCICDAKGNCVDCRSGYGLAPSAEGNNCYRCANGCNKCNGFYPERSDLCTACGSGYTPVFKNGIGYCRKN